MYVNINMYIFKYILKGNSPMSLSGSRQHLGFPFPAKLVSQCARGITAVRPSQDRATQPEGLSILTIGSKVRVVVAVFMLS